MYLAFLSENNNKKKIIAHFEVMLHLIGAKIILLFVKTLSVLSSVSHK